MNNWLPVNVNSWDWISIRDRFETLSGCLDVPPNDPQGLVNELRSIAAWIEIQADPGRCCIGDDMNKNTRENTACFDELEAERPQDIKLVQFTRRTNNPKLAWLQNELDRAGIFNTLTGWSFHAPILAVDESRLDDAWKILTPVDDVPDDDVMFSEHFPEYD